MPKPRGFISSWRQSNCATERVGSRFTSTKVEANGPRQWRPVGLPSWPNTDRSRMHRCQIERPERVALAARPSMVALAPARGGRAGARARLRFGLQHYLSLEALRRYQTSLAGFVDANAALAALAYLARLCRGRRPVVSRRKRADHRRRLHVRLSSPAPRLPLVAATIGATLDLPHRAHLARRSPRRARRARGCKSCAKASSSEGSAISSSSASCRSSRSGWSTSPRRSSACGSSPMWRRPRSASCPATFVFSYFGEGLGTALEAERLAAAAEALCCASRCSA